MIKETRNIVNEGTKTKLRLSGDSIDVVGTSEALDVLIAEMGEGFYNYVNWIGLAKDPNLVVLSSRHNYFYDAEEMREIKTVINLKELNKTREIKGLLQSCLHFLPQKSNFVGYFVNNEKIDRYVLRNCSSYFANKKIFEDTENSIISRIPFMNMLFSKLDFKTNTYMSEKTVSLLLEDYYFKVRDMTEHNGLTFFHAQKFGNTYS